MDQNPERFISIGNHPDIQARLVGDPEYISFVTRIHKYISENNLDMVKSILETGEELDLEDSSIYWLTLAHAALLGHADLVEYFLSKGVKPNSPATEEYILNLVRQRGHVDVVNLLVKHGANVVPMRPDLLSWAVESDNPEMIEMALKNGMLLERTDSQGYTALCEAAKLSKLNSFKFLLDKGANYRLFTSKNNPLTGGNLYFPLFMACQTSNDKSKFLTTLLEHIKRKEGKNAMVDYINFRNVVGMTVLHAACTFQSEEAVRTLIQYGANTRVKDFSQKTPVDYVDQRGRNETSRRIRSMIEAHEGS